MRESSKGLLGGGGLPTSEDRRGFLATPGYIVNAYDNHVTGKVAHVTKSSTHRLLLLSREDVIRSSTLSK